MADDQRSPVEPGAAPNPPTEDVAAEQVREAIEQAQKFHDQMEALDQKTVDPTLALAETVIRQAGGFIFDEAQVQAMGYVISTLNNVLMQGLASLRKAFGLGLESAEALEELEEMTRGLEGISILFPTIVDQAGFELGTDEPETATGTNEYLCPAGGLDCEGCEFCADTIEGPLFPDELPTGGEAGVVGSALTDEEREFYAERYGRNQSEVETFEATISEEDAEGLSYIGEDEPVDADAEPDPFADDPSEAYEPQVNAEPEGAEAEPAEPSKPVPGTCTTYTHAPSENEDARDEPERLDPEKLH